jgi:Ni,Fe-hydrogenase III large subunit
MTHMNLHGTQNERKEMEHGKEIEHENLETRSVQQVEYCDCCGEPMTQVEVLESYLEQSIEQALDVCVALRAEYDTAVQFELLERITSNLVEAATLTEAARLMPEGG